MASLVDTSAVYGFDPRFPEKQHIARDLLNGSVRVVDPFLSQPQDQSR